MEKYALTVQEAAMATSISRSRLYELIKAGRLATRKLGGATLILSADLKSFLETLPLSGGQHE